MSVYAINCKFYLGIMSLKSMWQGQSKLAIGNDSLRQHNIFKQGIVVSVLNPKVALFFLSFLPQFVDLSTGSADTKRLFLGLLFSTLATLCNLAYAIVGSYLLNNPKANRYTRIIEGLSGGLLVGLAGKIARTK